MTEHTPGPWTATGNGGEDEAYLVVKRDNHSDILSHIARMYDVWICDEHGGTAKANARLIAAAPELLAACRAIAQLADGQGRANMLEVAGQARAAILKAEKKEA